MLKKNAGGPGLALVLFLLLIVVRVDAQSVVGGPVPTDAGWGGGMINGMVHSPSGQRLSRRISVRLRSMDKGDRVATTDDNGKFTFTGVPPGDYVVIIDKEQGFEPYSENVSFRSVGSAPLLNIRLRLKGEPKSGGVVNAEFANVPARALEFYQKALNHGQAGNHKAAIEQLQKAIAEYSDFMLAFNELGVQYLRLGELDKAEEALAKARKLAPDSATPLLTHGILLTVMGKFNLAVTELQTALKQREQSANGHLYLGQALANLGRFAEAEVHLARAIELGGDEVTDAHRFLGAIYLQRGEREKALAEFETYLKLAPKAKDAEKVRQLIRQNKPSRNHVMR